MEGWTSQRVLQLAPDPASGKAGQGQASPKKWPLTGHDAAAIWGECQGSGAKPYQVRVELSGPSFACSCPSRKFPCKHGIGLMLMYAADQVAAGSRPIWVTDWLAARAERSEKKQATADAPPKAVDDAARAKRRDKQLSQVGDGLASLDVWLHDLVRGGVAAVPAQGPKLFDAPARRMVDAKAAGVAARLRQLANVASGGAGWERPFVEGLASLHLLVAAHGRADRLPAETRDDVMAALGVPVPTEEVLARPGVRDRWQIVAREVTVEDKVRTVRAWLFGTACRLPAAVLTFAYAGQAADVSLVPGFAVDAELCFHPGHGVRAAVKSRGATVALPVPDGLETLDSLCDFASHRFAAHPWLGEFAVPVRGLVPVTDGSDLSLIDRDRRSLPAVLPLASRWTLLAISGGHPVDLTVAFDGRRLRPLAVFHDGGLTSLTPAEA